MTEHDLGHTLRFRNIATDSDGTSTSDSLFEETFIPLETSMPSRSARAMGLERLFARTTLESRCGAPTPVPTILQPATNFLYDQFPVRSLLNEPVCLVARTPPMCGSGVTPSLYDPVFAPAAGLAANFAANSGGALNSAAMASTVLQPAGARVVTVAIGNTAVVCAAYSVTLGADAPFAGARPEVAGTPIEGNALTASDGSWSGTPALSHSWLRCDADAGACETIPRAAAASYMPTAPTFAGACAPA